MQLLAFGVAEDSADVAGSGYVAGGDRRADDLGRIQAG